MWDLLGRSGGFLGFGWVVFFFWSSLSRTQELMTNVYNKPSFRVEKSCSYSLVKINDSGIRFLNLQSDSRRSLLQTQS